MIKVNAQELDSNDFYERLLRHLALSDEVHNKAKECRLRPEDFMSSEQYGIRLYREIADIILTIGDGAKNVHTLLDHLQIKQTEGKIEPSQEEIILRLVLSFYDPASGELTPQYFIERLPLFVKRRREEKAKLDLKDNTDELRKRLNKIAVDLDVNLVNSKAKIINPFSELILPELHTLVPTGFTKVDALIGGLGAGEYGIIIGFTGSGKTAACICMLMSCAAQGIPVAYIPLEDTVEGVALRCYSRRYRINYSDLHSGAAVMELTQAWQNDKDIEGRDLLAKHVRIIGLKEAAPVTTNRIKAELDRQYEETGFIPRLVIVDQMSFITPNDPTKGSLWEAQQLVSNECDQLSHHPIGGQQFALWVTHQAKGKVKLDINREEVQGFKGIDQPSDTSLYLGRDGAMSNHFVLASLKCRHTTNFRIEYTGELQYMSFKDRDINIAPIENQIKENKKQPAIGVPTPQLTKNPFI